jgi:plastocyanin
MLCALMIGARLSSIVILIGIVSCSTAPPQPAAAPAASTSGPAVVTGRAAPGAVVMLEPADKELPLPEGPAVLDQYGKAFVPDVLFVRVGQVVEFRNSEDVDHNIRVLRSPTGTMVMDVSGSQNQVFTHTFEQPGTFEVSCDVHPGMRGTIVATRTPYAAETDARGGFTLREVPAGAYVLKVLASGRETTQSVTVTSPATDVGQLAR